MNNVSVVEAIKFGYDKSKKHFLFFVSTFIVSGLVWFGCFLLSGLVVAPFFIPAANVVKKIVAIFQASGIGEQAQMAFMGALVQVADLISKSPWSFTLAVIGILVFIALIWAFTMMVSFGVIKIFLDIYDKGSSTLANLFVRPIYIFRLFIFSILIFFVVVAPFVLPALAYKFSSVLALIFLLPAIIVSTYFVLKFFYSSYFIIDKGLGPIEAMKRSWGLRGAPVKLLLFWMLLVVLAIFLGIPAQLLVLLNSQAPHMVWGILLIIFNLVIRYFLGVITLMGYVYLYRRLSSPSV